ncbi:hypothetical protein CL617_05335 [archaeon]|nr:hypothetical protein [archaeon]|tara:strand:+ start:1396 stop:2442 length:1047 start_codon:yes stop_codon:yes gene_type:complete
MEFKRKLSYFLRNVAFNKKLINYIAIETSKKLKLKKPLGLPHTIMIEPNNICNLKCPLCPTGERSLKRPLGQMALDTFQKVLDDVGDSTIHLRLWNWGEPLLNKDLFKMIKRANRKKIFINISTNGTFLNKDNVQDLVDCGLDEIIVSVDGASQKTYEKYRIGGHLDTILKGIKLLAEAKKEKNSKTPYINLQFILMSHNEHEISEIRKIAHELGVNALTFKSVGIMDVELDKDIEKYLPNNPDMGRYISENNKLTRKLTARNMCDTMYDETTIAWDGNVLPCCNDPHGSYSLGNVLKEDLKDIWIGEKYMKLRKIILTKKVSIPMCKDCPGHTRDAPVKREILNPIY